MTEWIKCDSCPAQAKFLARSTDGELSFCGHHYNKNSEAIDKWSYEVIELDKKEEAIPILEKAE
jgi:hypothetical protein